jgi:uncharacterized protein YbaR (Trm112 family)
VAEPASLLACPACRGPLEAKGAELRCTGCRRNYPVIGDLPCLVPDPASWLAHWLQQLDLQENAGRLETEMLSNELKAAERESTRRRLSRLIQARQKQRSAIELVLAPLLKARKKSIPLAIELGQKGQPSQTLLYHYANILRDWSWGEEENRISAGIVLEAAGKPLSLGACAVLGAGACRLASDLHQADSHAQVYALDLNPLLLFAGKRVLDGAALELPEFPVAPISIEAGGELQSCASSARIDSRLKLLIADVLSAPFRERSLDTVVTPWLVDVLPVDARAFLTQVNRLLKPGGRWIHFGPLGFLHSRSALNYSPEEFEEVIGESGFEIGSKSWSFVPYLSSPLKGQKREERVLSLSARKTAEAGDVGSAPASPDWVQDSSLPIPVTPALAAPAESLHRALEIMSLVDGKRSIAEIAGKVASHYQLDPRVAEAQVKNLFRSLIGARGV